MGSFRGTVRAADPHGRNRALLMGALAFIAVMASHQIAYRLAAPDPHYRAELLHATGHRYFVYIAGAALGLLVAALTTFLRSAVDDRGDGRGRFVFAAPRLLIAQVGGFLALEATERLFLGGEVRHLLTEKPVLIGLVLQVIVALIGAASLCLVAYVARRLHGRVPDLRGSVERVLLPRLEPLPLRALAEAGAADPRGPPTL